MQHVHLDLIGGMAGDMFAAALIDAFPQSLEPCLDDLCASGVLDYVDVRMDRGTSHGLQVQRFIVEKAERSHPRTAHYRDLAEFLRNSALNELVKQRSLALLRLLAEAESTVHGVKLDDVHFHEIADWDSIADVVAAGSLIERNQIGSWSCGSVPMGSGEVQTEHGVMPLPAPAAMELLRGFTVHDDCESGERVTPTGAAILKYIMTDADGKLQHRVQRAAGAVANVGTGAGIRELFGRPNIVRCTVLDISAVRLNSSFADTHSLDQDGAAILELADDMATDDVVELNFAVDDMTPEELAVALDHIRVTDGVLDVSSEFGMGKKSRAVFNVTVLCEPHQEELISRCCFSQTSTLGIRVQHIKRRVLVRVEKFVEDDGAAVSVKLAQRPGCRSAKVASDDLHTLPSLEARRRKARQIHSRLLAEQDGD